VRALAETIAALLGVTPRFVEKPPRAGEIRHSLGSPAMARTLLDLPPPKPLRDGLRAVLDWLAAGGFQKKSDFTA
jgi:UDP-glucose 4-epimerase